MTKKMQLIDIYNDEGVLECSLIADGTINDEQYAILSKEIDTIWDIDEWQAYQLEQIVINLLTKWGFEIYEFNRFILTI